MKQPKTVGPEQRQQQIIRALDDLGSRNLPEDVGSEISELIEEYAHRDELLGELVDRYASNPSLHLVSRLTNCIRLRMWKMEPSLATSLVLRIVHLHTCYLSPGILLMLVAPLNYKLIAERNASGDELPDLRKLVDLCLASEPRNLSWPVLEVLDNLREEGLLESVVGAERAHIVERLRDTFVSHGIQIDEEDSTRYTRLMEELQQLAEGH